MARRVVETLRQRNYFAVLVQLSFVVQTPNRINAIHLKHKDQMRDHRFVAAHRGGPLDKDSHILLARWAADCADEVLHFFTQASDDERPKHAIEIARAWANGEVKTGVAMKASVASHAAARKTTDKAATAAARAAGQAVATAHFADHCMGALLYELKGLEAAGLNSDTELQTRLNRLPDHLRDLVESGVLVRLLPLGIKASLAP